MPIEPVKIPQNVYIEDQIVGPLTMRQLIIMCLGGGISYVIYATVQKTAGQGSIFVTAICWIPMVIATAFALIKINNLSLMRIVFLIMERTYKSPTRTYTARRGISINFHTSYIKTPADERKEKLAEDNESKSRTKIQELSRIVDRPVTDVALPDADMIAADQAPAAPAINETPTPQEIDADEEDRPLPLPVEPGKISVDGLTVKKAPENPKLSNLEVFRDIFNPHRP